MDWNRHNGLSQIIGSGAMPSYDVAILGLGQMGSRYAQRLIDVGVSVAVWNRSPARSAPFSAAGIKVTNSPAEAADCSDVIIAALENSAAFADSLLSKQMLARLGPKHLVIDTSTVHPRDSRAADQILRECGAHYLDAPVSGGTRGAASGTLTIFVGGSTTDFERGRPILEKLGTPHLLGATGAGHITKLVNQAIVAVTIGAVAEGLFLAERAGLNPKQMLKALEGGFADSRILREHGDRMIRRDFSPGGTNRIFLKDLNEIHALAAELDSDLPLTTRSHKAYVELVATGFDEHDHSSYFEYLELLNKSPPTDETDQS
jgi:3-hydroxyisobutyrate dehydrogenase-like beta-hydroxyacid dehydrogenase